MSKAAMDSEALSTHPPMSNSLTDFTLFPLLPVELRLKIYDQLLPIPPYHTKRAKHPRRILKISYAPALSSYVSATAPPPLLHVSHEARIYTQNYYTPLLLGSNVKSPTFKANIPISFAHNTLYLSSIQPLRFTHLDEIIYQLSTSPSRHHIQSLAVDLQVWAELVESGFLALLGRMKGLKEFLLVVEFGRTCCFEGQYGFLEIPDWRGDLSWLAETAETKIQEQRVKARNTGVKSAAERDGGYAFEKVGVRCVILTKGGEQA